MKMDFVHLHSHLHRAQCTQTHTNQLQTTRSLFLPPSLRSVQPSTLPTFSAAAAAATHRATQSCSRPPSVRPSVRRAGGGSGGGGVSVGGLCPLPYLPPLFLSKGGALPGRGPRQSRDEGRHFIHTELPAYSQNTPGKGICCQTSTTTGNYGVLLNSVHSITSHARLW